MMSSIIGCLSASLEVKNMSNRLSLFLDVAQGFHSLLAQGGSEGVSAQWGVKVTPLCWNAAPMNTCHDGHQK